MFMFVVGLIVGFILSLLLLINILDKTNKGEEGLVYIFVVGLIVGFISALLLVRFFPTILEEL